MFERTRNLLRKVGVKLGIIQELKSVQEHRKVSVDEEAYRRIAKNKAIYSGYYPEWHVMSYKTSRGIPKTRDMIGMDMGKVIPQKMAALVFNEKCKIEISNLKGEEDLADEFIKETFRKNNFYHNFQRYLEYMFSMGGMAIKAYFWNGEVRLAYAAADAFYPLSNDQDNIDEALFVNMERKNDYYYTLLEWHEWEGSTYVITNELYQSNIEGQLGIKVPLNTLYKELDPVTRIEDLKRPLFVYLKPNIANNKDLNSPLGISLFENSYKNLYTLDFMHDFWYREFDLGKRRIAVDRSMLKPFPDENGIPRTTFDEDETVYDATNMEGQPVKDLTVPLRTEEIISSINAELDILAMKIGLNPGTFRFDGTGVKTATEVVSQNSETYRTKNSHEVLIEAALKDLIVTILQVGQLYEVYPKGDEYLDLEIGIDFDDSIAQDRQENYNFYANATSMGLLPKLEAIQRIFNVPEEKAKEMMQQIIEEKKAEAGMYVSNDMEMDPEGVE